MDLFEYLQTPIGVELTHAVIVLLLSVAAYLTWRTHQVATSNADRLTDHLVEHAARDPQDVVSELPKGSDI